MKKELKKDMANGRVSQMVYRKTKQDVSKKLGVIFAVFTNASGNVVTGQMDYIVNNTQRNKKLEQEKAVVGGDREYSSSIGIKKGGNNEMSRVVSVYPNGVQRGRLTQVVARFLCKRTAWGRSLATDGVRLYSYMVIIGRWDGEAVRLPESHRFYSRTTTRHRNMLRDMATARSIPVIES